MHSSSKGYKSGSKRQTKNTGAGSRSGKGKCLYSILCSIWASYSFLSAQPLIAPIGKNMKDLFLKKLQICMKTYDYNDETKDVKGKVTIIILRVKGSTLFQNYRAYCKNRNKSSKSSSLILTRSCRWSRRTYSDHCPTSRNPTWLSVRQVLNKRKR